MATQDRPLTTKQRIFTEGILRGLTGIQACIEAGYKGDKHQLSVVSAQNLGKLSIKKVIDGRRAELAKKTEFTVIDAHKLYQDAYEEGKKRGQTGSMVGAATGISRLYGYDKDSGGGREQTIIIIGPKAPVKAIESEPVVSKELLEGEPCP